MYRTKNIFFSIGRRRFWRQLAILVAVPLLMIFSLAACESADEGETPPDQQNGGAPQDMQNGGMDTTAPEADTAEVDTSQPPDEDKPY